MTEFSSVISVSLDNSATTPRPIYLEPWGEDYWLFPGDVFKIRAFGDQEPPSSNFFDIVESADATQVYVEGRFTNFEVLQNGKSISGGYQRAQRIGQADHSFTIRGRGIVISSDSPWQGNPKVGDQLRLVIPGKQVVKAQVLGLEHIQAVNRLENPWGIFWARSGLQLNRLRQRRSFID